MQKHKKHQILVVGESSTDYDVFGECSPINRWSVSSSFVERRRDEIPGMADIVAQNLTAMGACVTFITQLPQFKRATYIDYNTRHRIVRIDDAQECDRVSNEALRAINYSKCDAVVIDDHDAGFLSIEDICFICASHKTVVLRTNKIVGQWAEDARLIQMSSHQLDASSASLAAFSGSEDKVVVLCGADACSMGATAHRQKSRVFCADYRCAEGAFLAGLAIGLVNCAKTEPPSVANGAAMRVAGKCVAQVVSGHKGVVRSRFSVLG